MKNSADEHSAVTDGVLADLFWKLRLRREYRDGVTLDIHRLRKDASYREASLAEAAGSGDAELAALADSIRQRLAQLRGPDGAPPRSASRRAGVAIALGLVALVAGAGLYFVTGGDGKPAPLTNTPQDNRAAPATQPEAPARTLFRIHGSNTVGEELAPALVKDYLASLGGEDIAVTATEVARETLIRARIKGQPLQVEIHAHGSSTAFADLAAGTTDIGMASRRIKAEEVDQLKAKLGDLSQSGSEHVIALDGLAVIVHPALPVAELTVDTIARLFAGEIANWRELGGPDLAVELFARDDNSGTWDSFESLVLKPHGRQLAPVARRFESSQALSDGVSTTPGAIGFIGLPYVRQAKLLAVSGAEDALAAFPNNFTVSTEDYALSRRLYLYLPAIGANTEARRFIDFVRGRAGQNVVADVGFISQSINATRPTLAADLPYDYPTPTENAQRLSVNFRFEPGSDRIDNKGQRDLDRLADFILSNPGKRVLLLGFTDSVGHPDSNLKLSQARAELVGRELMKFGIFPYQVSGFGAAAAVASNDNAEGRNRNRREQAWVI